MLKHLSPAYDEEISESPWIVAQPTPVFFSGELSQFKERNGTLERPIFTHIVAKKQGLSSK